MVQHYAKLLYYDMNVNVPRSLCKQVTGSNVRTFARYARNVEPGNQSTLRRSKPKLPSPGRNLKRKKERTCLRMKMNCIV